MKTNFVTASCIGTRGEFGNHLFQISAALGYAHKNDCKAIFKPWVCQHGNRDYSVYFPKLAYTTDIVSRNIYAEPRFAYDEIPVKPALDIIGSFQSERYFWEIRDTIKDIFQEPMEIGSQVEAFLKTHKLSDYSAFHMRFYDRETRDKCADIHTLPEHYFIEASKKLRKDTKVVIVTNSATRAKLFAKDHLKGFDVLVCSNSDSLVDFYILTRAQSIIISNSTFGWWGAYLNRRVDKVYAPALKKWFAFPSRLEARWSTEDLYPDHFIEVLF